ncbi:unnamed protein product [Candida verbasci]|uniref:Transcription factor IWS1 n=1 Tax=Candida verbasci TaxID=1227364 RepID=A0A9W4TU59_9ASCO|nr:unnamed protein product [Candida verbasci]
MSDPLADFTNLSQDEIDPNLKEENEVNNSIDEQMQEDEQMEHHEDLAIENSEQQNQEDQQQQEEDIELPEHQEEFEATENAEDPEGDKYEEYEEDDEIYKNTRAPKIQDDQIDHTYKKIIRKSRPEGESTNENQVYQPTNTEENNTFTTDDLDPQQRRRFELEERMNAAIKTKSTKKKKADEHDLEQMADDRIEYMKDQMIKAANLDAEKNANNQIATEKLKLLNEVLDVLSKSDLAESILDNNMLEAVRLWLEPLPDASMPAYQIQKELIHALERLPIKTDHLVASGIGKVLVFYQRSKRTESQLKKIVDRLISDWTRPILNKSDSYKDRSIRFGEYDKRNYANKLSKSKRKEAKTLYEENAERRKRAAIPTARSAAYKIAPRVDPSVLLRHSNGNNDERFRKINQTLTSMGTKRKKSKKGGPSIEGRDLAL